MKRTCLMIFLCLVVCSAYAGGFRVALQSAKQLGMGHVGAGLQVGPESIFYNPGALSVAEKGGISISGSAVMANVSYNTPGSAYQSELEDNIGTPFGAYGSFKISENLAGGLGVYTPYGNAVEWPEDWAGRYINQKVDLAAIFIQPTLSYAITDKLGIGAGLIYTLGEVTLERAIPLTATPEPNVKLETDGYATGIGFNAGIFYEPTEEFSFGVNYRSKVDVEAEDGIVSVENLPASIQASGSFDANQFNAELPLPAELAVGVGMKLSDRFTLASDFNYTFWNSYESLDFYFNGNLGNQDGDLAQNDVSVNPQNWSDSWTIKLGGQYDVSDKFLLRAGGYRDYSPIPDETLAPITPDADRFGFTGGFSFLPSDQFSIDGALLYLYGEERTVQASENINGFGQRYRNTALIPSLGLNYSF